jgi:hypothetical protein
MGVIAACFAHLLSVCTGRASMGFLLLQEVGLGRVDELQVLQTKSMRYWKRYVSHNTREISGLARIRQHALVCNTRNQFEVSE